MFGVNGCDHRSYQHATNDTRLTEGFIELQESGGIEPPDHGIGRSRGGLSTKIHELIDGHGLLLVTLLSPGQAGDSPMFLPRMHHLRATRKVRRPRTHPVAVRADKQAVARTGHSI